MKNILILLLIAGVAGCGEKKSGNGGITSVSGYKDTSVVGSLIITKSNQSLHVCRIHVGASTKHPDSHACLDTLGKWHIYGECSDIIENFLIMEKWYRNEIDSLKRELDNVRRSRADYDYATINKIQ